MKFLFLIDPLETVVPEKDTSYAFMVGACQRGHEVAYLAPGGISIRGSEVLFEAEPVVPTPGQAAPFSRSVPRRSSAAEVDAVFIRLDPPFDQRYLQSTWLLDHAAGQVVMINSTAGLREVNEKLWSARLTELCPPTLITSRRELYEEFLAVHGEIIAKPTDGYGGQGVFRVASGDPNAAVIFETLTDQGRRELIAQQYLPRAVEGDKRILLLDSEPLGAVLRLHGEADHRNNFFAGGTAHPAEITPADERIVAALAPRLRRLGLHFVGIDVIGERLIEVNVTSPTCLQEINRLYDRRLEDQVVAYVERLVQLKRKERRS